MSFLASFPNSNLLSNFILGKTQIQWHFIAILPIFIPKIKKKSGRMTQRREVDIAMRFLFSILVHNILLKIGKKGQQSE